MTRLVLVGEDFGRSEVTREGEALTGASGRRIADLAGIGWSAYLRRTERVNVVTRPADWSDLDAILVGVERVRRRIAGRETVLLGQRVARVLGSSADLFVWRAGVAVAPHPSGRNRWWNDPAHVDRARAFWSAALGDPC